MSPAASRLRWPATLAILLAFFPWVGAKNYDVRRVHIQAAVRSDGGVEVEETLVFSFRGSYKYAYRDIPLAAGQSISRIAVAEKGTAYREDSSGSASTSWKSAWSALTATSTSLPDSTQACRRWRTAWSATKVA